MEARAASLQGRFHDLRAEVKHLRAQAEQAQQGITNELARLETLYASLWESEAALEKLRSGWTAMLAMVSSFRSSTEVQTGGPLEEAGPWSLRERHQRKPGA